MGFLSLIGTCGACAHPFLSNPEYVPSPRLDDGQQLIFCRPGVEAANSERACRGLPPIVIHRLAYEPAEA